jgi:hypothetical protein
MSLLSIFSYYLSLPRSIIDLPTSASPIPFCYLTLVEVPTDTYVKWELKSHSHMCKRVLGHTTSASPSALSATS